MRQDQRSPEAKSWRGFYATGLWKKGRKAFLQSNPICKRCQARGQIVAASVVNHIKPHKGDWAIFSDPGNWEALCPPCHDAGAQKAEGAGYSAEAGLDGWPTDPNHPANRPR